MRAGNETTVESHILLSYFTPQKLETVYSSLPNIRPGLLILFWTKSPWGRPYFDRVSNFFCDIFPIGLLIITESLISFSFAF